MQPGLARPLLAVCARPVVTIAQAGLNAFDGSASRLGSRGRKRRGKVSCEPRSRGHDALGGGAGDSAGVHAVGGDVKDRIHELQQGMHVGDVWGEVGWGGVAGGVSGQPNRPAPVGCGTLSACSQQGCASVSACRSRRKRTLRPCHLTCVTVRVSRPPILEMSSM